MVVKVCRALVPCLEQMHVVETDRDALPPPSWRPAQASGWPSDGGEETGEEDGGGGGLGA